MRSKLTPYLLVLFLSFQQLSVPSAFGKQCKGDTCIGVTTDDKSVVITVQKGKPGSSKTTKPAPKKPKTTKPQVAKPKTWIPWLPKAPAPKSSVKPTPRKANKKPRVTKIKATSLTDQVRELLPGGIIEFQPKIGALRGEPVNFLTSVPNRFQATIVVLDIPIRIDLRANYRWQFGDGGFLETLESGAPYPVGRIRHTYKNAGTNLVSLFVIWRGRWSAGGISGPIEGEIRQNFQRELVIHAADTNFIK